MGRGSQSKKSRQARSRKKTKARHKGHAEKAGAGSQPTSGGSASPGPGKKPPVGKDGSKWNGKPGESNWTCGNCKNEDNYASDPACWSCIKGKRPPTS